MEDRKLIKQYVKDGSEAAFSAIMERHMPMVYSACLREIEDCDLARDAAQATFLVLARRAGSIGTILNIRGWLFHTARLCAKNVARGETRRKAKEAVIAVKAHLSETRTDQWLDIRPLLNDAIAALKLQDREIILMRYYQDMAHQEIASELGIKEEAARARLVRAITRLRNHMVRHGVTIGASTLAVLLDQHRSEAVPLNTGSHLYAIIASDGASGVNITKAAHLNHIARSVIKAYHASQLKLAAGLITALLLFAGSASLMVKAQSHKAVKHIAKVAVAPAYTRQVPDVSPLPAKSDPKAIVLAQKIRKAYASLTTLSCTEKLVIENRNGGMPLSIRYPFNFVTPPYTNIWQWSKAYGDTFDMHEDMYGETGRIFDTNNYRYSVNIPEAPPSSTTVKSIKITWPKNVYAVMPLPIGARGDFISYDSPMMIENLLRTDSAINKILNHPNATYLAPGDGGYRNKRLPIPTRLTLKPDTYIDGKQMHTLCIGQYLSMTHLYIEVILYTGISDNLARKIALSMSTSDVNIPPIKYTYSYSNIRINPSIPNETFHFVPPSNAKQIKLGLPPEPGAAAIMAQMENTYRKMHAIHYSIENVYWSHELSQEEWSRIASKTNKTYMPRSYGYVKTTATCAADKTGKWEFHLSANPCPDQGNYMENEQPANLLRPGWTDVNVISGVGPDIKLGKPITIDGQIIDVIVTDCHNSNAGGGPSLEHSMWYLYIGRDDHLLHRKLSMSTYGSGEEQWYLDQKFTNIKVN